MGVVRGWLIVAGDFMPHGGMDRANLELARFLAAEYPVHLVTHRCDLSLVTLPNVTVHRVPRPLGSHLLGQSLLARVGRRWARRLSRDGYRVVVNGGNCCWADINWVHCVHAAYTSPLSGPWWYQCKQWIAHRHARLTERRAIRQADSVICNSRRTAQDVVERLGVRPNRVYVVYLGCDPTTLSPVGDSERTAARQILGWDNRPWLVFIGQLGNGIKGFDTLYTAWERLSHDPSWDACLAVIGDGINRARWQARWVDEATASRIHFLGFRTDVPTILAAGNALVAPSRYDAYGLGVHEAICRGLPAIVSSACGISERYPPELHELILQNPEDVGELVDRLRHWRNNMERYAALVRPFSDQLRARTWTDMARDIRDLVFAHS